MGYFSSISECFVGCNGKCSMSKMCCQSEPLRESSSLILFLWFWQSWPYLPSEWPRNSKKYQVRKPTKRRTYRSVRVFPLKALKFEELVLLWPWYCCVKRLSLHLTLYGRTNTYNNMFIEKINDICAKKKNWAPFVRYYLVSNVRGLNIKMISSGDNWVFGVHWTLTNRRLKYKFSDTERHWENVD